MALSIIKPFRIRAVYLLGNILTADIFSWNILTAILPLLVPLYHYTIISLLVPLIYTINMYHNIYHNIYH